MLTSRQIADVVAFLQAQKKAEPLKAVNGSFRFEIKDGKMDLLLDQERVATYLLKHDQLTRRAFVNVRTPSGIPVTRNFPRSDPKISIPATRARKGSFTRSCTRGCG